MLLSISLCCSPSTPIVYELTTSMCMTNVFYPDAPHSHSYALFLRNWIIKGSDFNKSIILVSHNSECELYRLFFRRVKMGLVKLVVKRRCVIEYIKMSTTDNKMHSRSHELRDVTINQYAIVW
jgi:hypothetical protein